MPLGRRRGPMSMSGKASVTSLIDQTRQRLGLGMAGRDKTFVPTPNVRNPQMLVEAEDFERHLATFEGAARRYHDVVQRFLYNLIPLLNTNLPRVWVAVEGGLCEPVRSNISHGHPSRIGGDYDDEGLRSQLVSLEQKLSEDILAPLKRWHEGLAIARERMSSLDRLRGEVDRERLAADKKFRKAERRIHKAYARGTRGNSSSSSSSEDEGAVAEVRRGQMLEDYTRLALVTERKLGALTASYGDQERLVWEQLSGLVRDAAWLESYIVATMLLVKETMQGAALMLGPTKQPLPAYKASRDRAAVEYGGLAHNMPLVAQMAPRASELVSGAAPRAGLGLQPPLLTLRAHRGVATPLSVGVSSNPRAAALEAVPSVAAGAGHVPLALVGPEIQQEAQRVEAAAHGSGVRVVEPGSSIGTPRGTATPPALMAPPSVTSGSERGRISSPSMGITPAGGASPRVRRITDSSADEIPSGYTRVRRVTDASDDGLTGSGVGSYSRAAPSPATLPTTSSSRFAQGGTGITSSLPGGLSAGAAKGWQQPPSAATGGSNMQREPSFTPMGGETYPSAADMQQVVPREGSLEEGGVTSVTRGDVPDTNGNAVSAIQREVEGLSLQEGERSGTPAVSPGTPGVTSMTPLGGDNISSAAASPQQQLPLTTHTAGATKMSATQLVTPAAAAPAGDDSLGVPHVMAGDTGASSKPLSPTEAVKEELASGAAAAGQELVFRPYPGQQAPGMVPHSHPVATA